MTDSPAVVAGRPTLSDDLLARRPVWGPFIGGAFIDVLKPDTFDVLEAATGRPLASVVSASEEIVARAVSDSRRA